VRAGFHALHVPPEEDFGGSPRKWTPSYSGGLSIFFRSEVHPQIAPSENARALPDNLPAVHPLALYLGDHDLGRRPGIRAQERRREASHPRPQDGHGVMEGRYESEPLEIRSRPLPGFEDVGGICSGWRIVRSKIRGTFVLTSKGTRRSFAAHPTRKPKPGEMRQIPGSRGCGCPPCNTCSWKPSSVMCPGIADRQKTTQCSGRLQIGRNPGPN